MNIELFINLDAVVDTYDKKTTPIELETMQQSISALLFLVEDISNAYHFGIYFRGGREQYDGIKRTLNKFGCYGSRHRVAFRTGDGFSMSVSTENAEFFTYRPRGRMQCGFCHIQHATMGVLTDAL